MKPSRHTPRAPRPAPAAAFTMIEIAMSLAIIGFALVTIIGILPMGMDVQKNNRRETIINQDANFFIEAIRSGARGLDDLTNYVQAITISNSVTGSQVNFVNPNLPSPMTFGGAVNILTNGEIIMGLLGRPKYTPGGVNYVVAYVRALSGAASEKPPQDNALINEAAFSYRMVSEIVPYGAVTNTYYDESWRNAGNQAVLDNLANNLYDVRLLFRWPLLPGGKIGNGRQVYRLMVGGAQTKYNLGGPPELYFFRPQNYINAP